MVTGAVQARSEAGREFRISQPAVRYSVPAGQAAGQASSTQAASWDPTTTQASLRTCAMSVAHHTLFWHDKTT